MKKVAIFLLLIVNIYAQQSGILKSKYGSEEFEGLTFDNYRTEKSIPKLPALLKSSIANSNPEFVSVNKDTAYQYSPYSFNIFTNDLDDDEVTISSSSTPSWLTFNMVSGGKVETLTKPWNILLPSNNVDAKSVQLLPTNIIFDSSGNAYFTSYQSHAIFKIDTNGILTVIAGNGEQDWSPDGSPAATSPITFPKGITFDLDNNIVFSEEGNHAVRKIDNNGNLITIAGNGIGGYSGDGGPATSAKLNSPKGISYDSSGNLYIAMGTHSIRKVDTNGIITTIAGSGDGINGFQGDGGPATSARFSHPADVIIDDNGNIIISDNGNHRIRKIDTDGIINTIAGNGGNGSGGKSGDGGPATDGEISYPEDLLLDADGNLYIKSSGGVRKVDSDGILSSITGGGGNTEDGAPALDAEIYPIGLGLKNNVLYLLVQSSYSIRTVDLSTGLLGTYAGGPKYKEEGVSAEDAFLMYPYSVKVHKNGDVYFIERSTNRIRKIDQNGNVFTVAGSGKSGYDGDGGSALDAKIGSPIDLAWDSQGNMYFSDPDADVIRKVDTDGIISTIAGTGESGHSNDGGTAFNAAMSNPGRLAFDKDDNLYIAEYGNRIIRVIDKEGIINTIAGEVGVASTSGDGGPAKDATFKYPTGLAFDSQGNLFIGDRDDCVVRKIDTNGNISLVAGTIGTCGDDGEGGPATDALFRQLFYLTFDRADNLVIADLYNYKIKKIMNNGNVVTVAGTGNTVDLDSFRQPTARKSAFINAPLGIDIDTLGNIYFADYNSSTLRKITSSYGTLSGTPNQSDVGTTSLTFTATDENAGVETQSFTLEVIANDTPVITAVSDVTINEDESSTITLDATDADGDAITYSAVSDTNAITVSVSSSTLTLTPNANWHGVASIKAYASDGYSKDSTSFTLTVNPVSDIAAVQDVTIDEDKSTEITLTSTFTGTTTFTAVSDTSAVTTSISSSTLTLTPNANWYGVANIQAYASDGSSKDSTSFTLTVTAVNDAPTAFEWVSTSLDSINISQSNLTNVYDLEWSESIDVDLEEVDYLLYAQVGVFPAEEIGDTTSTSVQLTYEDLVVNVFDSFQMLPRATVRFSLHATDGIDTVKVTGDDRVLFINRYEYLSTVSEGIPNVFALHENYPNPFNPTTTLRFDLPEVSDATVTIYNMLGQIVRTFNMNDTPAGYHSIKWDATNDYGDPVGAGVYLYQLRANEFVKTKKMVLLK